MSVARRVVTLGRKLREDHRIKVRQPLKKLTVVHRSEVVRSQVEASRSLIENELNVKQVGIEADESAFTSVTVKPNFKVLGKRCGPKLKQIGAELAKWGHDEVSRLEAGETIVIEGEALGIDDVLLQRKAQADTAVATDSEITVVLDTHIDDALEREGLARECTSVFQNARKANGLEVTDRIRISYQTGDQKLRAALEQHHATIKKEVLALELAPGDGCKTEANVNGIPLCFDLEKA